MALALLLCVLFGGCSLGDDAVEAAAGRPIWAPTRGTSRRNELGFPARATRNTVRVDGADPAADAAGVASALFPATGSSDRPTAVALVDSGDWQTAVAAGGAGGAADRRPAAHLGRRRAAGGHEPGARPPPAQGLRPVQGRPGDPHRRGRRAPGGLQDRRGEGRRRVRALGRHRPLHLGGARAPVGQRRPLLERVRRVGAAGSRVGGALRRRRAAGQGRRDPPADPARARQPRAPERVPARPRPGDLEGGRAAAAQGPPGGLGATGSPAPRPWRTRSPSRATAGAASAGAWSCPATTSRSPTPSARSTPPRPRRSPPAACSRRCCSPTTRTSSRRPLENYLLSVQPGYEDDPGQAVYNRAWILGDDSAISVPEQAQVDSLTELIPVQSNAP